MTDSPDTAAGSPDPDDSPEPSEAEDADPEDAAEAADEDAPRARSAATDELWEEVGIEPVEIALPGDKVGYTLRAYRPTSQLTPTETAPAEDAEEEDDPFAERERARAREEAELAGEELDEDEDDLADESEEEEETEEEEEGEEEEEAADEEVPIFLSHRGKLLLFGSPESLVSYIGSDAPHDLTQLDTWPTVAKRARAEDIVPQDEDAYELDSVVENLRSGHDSWDLPLLIAAGELARDIGFALRMSPVITAMAPGSPLDDLDDALRATAAGGLGGMFARRRLRRIGAQQASLGWRTVIGKISAVVDWRD